MTTILDQVSYPVFLYCVSLFFIFASVFSFVVGVGFATRNTAMLRLFEFMNKSYSVRKAMKPLEMPHLVEPVLLKHPGLLGFGILLGSAISIYLLKDIDAGAFQPVFLGSFSYFSAVALAQYTKSFLLLGNATCMAIGLLLMFLPRLLSRIESCTDKWYTLRRETYPLNRMHLEVDQWALAHPAVFGATLSILSAGLFASMFTSL